MDAATGIASVKYSLFEAVPQGLIHGCGVRSVAGTKRAFKVCVGLGIEGID